MNSSVKIGKPLIGFFLLGIACSILSCSSRNSNDDNVYAMLAESLEISSKSMSAHANSELMELENKTKDPVTQIKALIWYPKAKQLHEYTTEILQYIDSLTLKIKSHPGEERSMNLTLANKLVQYEINMFAIDSQLLKHLSDYVSVFPSSLRSKDSTVEKVNLILNNLNKKEQLVILKQFKNNITHLASILIEFCNRKIYLDGIIFDPTYSAIIGQNTNHLKAGDTLEITAGMGAFTINWHPEILISGKNISLNQSGLATYKMKVANHPGKYKVPVIISYTNQDGKKQEMTKHVSYTIEE
jgi:hypothetical protein